MTKLLPLILIVFIFASCKNEVLKERTFTHPKRTVLTGKIKDYEKYSKFKVASIFYDDAVLNTRFREISEIDSNGYFKIEFKSYVSQWIGLKVDTHFGVFINAGDSLHIELIPNKRFLKQYESCSYSGDAKLENEILKAWNMSKNWDFQKYLNNNKNLKPKEFKKYLEGKKEKRIKFINQLLSQYNNVPEIFKKHLRMRTLTEYISHLCDYPHHHCSMNKKDVSKLKLGKNYYEIFDHYELNESNFADSDREIGFYNKFKIKTQDLDDLLEIKNQFMREILVCRYIASQLRERGYEEWTEYESIVRNRINTPILYSSITNYYQNLKKVALQKSEKVEISNKKFGSVEKLLNKIKEKHKGKVIYIDCWATWCAPCREEIQRSKPFHKRFEEKDVAFIFLCLDSPKKQWKNVIKSENIEGDHYFLDINQSQLIRKMYEISGVPFYILLNKNGKLVLKGNAFRPSNPQTKTEILKLTS
jgi:thiol-disulfide isomerase/thioredoxin